MGNLLVDESDGVREGEPKNRYQNTRSSGVNFLYYEGGWGQDERKMTVGLPRAKKLLLAAGRGRRLLLISVGGDIGIRACCSDLQILLIA